MKKNVLISILLLLAFSLDAKPKRRKSRIKTITSSVLRKKQSKPQKITAQRQAPKEKLPLSLAIHKAVQQAEKKAAVGIKIVSLKNDVCLFQKNADRIFTPASNTKIFTAGAALHILGPAFTFDTILLTDKRLSPHKINNLIIKGSGDPTLKVKDLEKLIHTLKERSINEIKGDLIIDNTIFDTSGVGPGWGKGDGPIFDKSPSGGLIINHSCITVMVKPSTVGHKPAITIDPMNSLNRIENNARTTTQAKKHSLRVTRTKDHRIVITGTIGKSSKPRYFIMAIDQPHLYAGHACKTLLKKHKIAHKGGVRVGAAPSSSITLARHSSKPAKHIITHMMKHSDNLYADSLFKAMGARMYGTPGTWAKGKKAVETFLAKEAGLASPKLSLNDGSGLSHANKVSPNHLTHFLSWVHKTAPFKTHFIESLPINGIDGSLRHRMKHKGVHAKVKAKTGTLFGVSALSGYITPRTGSELLFVIMVNRKNKSAVEFKRKLEDHLCSLLAAHAFSTS